MDEEFQGFHPQVSPAREHVAETDLEEELARCRLELKEARASLNAKIAEHDRECDRLLRQAAETDNVRKRSERSSAEQQAADRKRILRAFLPVADDLDRALSHQSAESVLGGVRIVRRHLDEILSRQGVARLECAGERFDPGCHEAVGGEAGPADRVVKEVEPGYTLNGDLLRPARVVVGLGEGEPSGPHRIPPRREARIPVEPVEGVSEPVEGP